MGGPKKTHGKDGEEGKFSGLEGLRAEDVYMSGKKEARLGWLKVSGGEGREMTRREATQEASSPVTWGGGWEGGGFGCDICLLAVIYITPAWTRGDGLAAAEEEEGGKMRGF